MNDPRALRRFRRRRRLTPHTVLYEGPYTEAGGLARLLEAAPLIRETIDDLVVAAIPDGDVDRRYRDRCDRLALALGHRGIVEWDVDAEERELWRAAATERLTVVPQEPDDVRRLLLAPADDAAIREIADSPT